MTKYKVSQIYTNINDVWTCMHSKRNTKFTSNKYIIYALCVVLKYYSTCACMVCIKATKLLH